VGGTRYHEYLPTCRRRWRFDAQMGCELVVPKYHVEFDVESDEEWLVDGDFTKMVHGVKPNDLSIWVPTDAVITELAPEAVAGWYQRQDPERKDVFYWDAQEIEEYPAEEFYSIYQRMKDPEPWAEVRYQDGYYRMSDGYLYRRDGGTWYLCFSSTGGWDTSSYDDDTIEEGCTVQYLGTEKP
jgi:hypothetical protein